MTDPHALRRALSANNLAPAGKRTVMVGRLTLLGALQIAIALLSLSRPAHGETRAAILRGREIAERACSGCHAIDGSKGATVQGTDVPSFRAIAARPNQTPERLETFIMVPHRPMPAMPLELSEVRDVVAYVLSLK